MAQTKKSKSKKPKVKLAKGKVKIPAYKIIILCSAIIAFCMVLLLITTIANSSEKSPAQVAIAERFEGQKKNPQTDIKEIENLKKTYAESNSKTKTEKSEINTEKKAVETKKTPEKTAAQPEQLKPQKPIEPKKEPAKPVSEAKKTVPATPAPAEPKSVTPKTVTPTPAAPKPEEKPAAPKTQPKKGMEFPVANNHAQLIFVFDDGGQNMAHLEKFMTLPFPITVAVLPQIVHSAESAARVRKSGNEVILHQPMQSINAKVNPGPGAITPDMSENQIKSILFQNINQIAPIAGLNNHEGSAITADAEKMAVILQYTSEQGIYFLDSRTNVETKVPYVAKEMGYSYYERNIFLDNEKSRENVIKELNKAINLANKNGYVIMIGHIWSADFLPEILMEAYPELVEKGYTFSTVSKSKAKKS